MRKREDSYLDPQPSEAEIAAQRDDELLRTKVREEVMRMHRGEADEDMARDQAAAAEREQQQQRREQRRKRRESSSLWLMLSGDILVDDGVARYYRNMAAMAIIFFISILVMFTALHLDVRYSRLEREVQLLRERSLDLQTERFQRCSHSSISSELERRGIELVDPTVPSVIIDR